MTKRIPVILDGDPGHDDAIAWVLAAASPMLEIKAVTSVCGNQTIEKTTYNAGRVMTLIGLDVPLAMGRVKPLVADAIIAPTRARTTPASTAPRCPNRKTSRWRRTPAR